jgi:hypothetical protein
MVLVEDLFADELAAGIPVFMGDRKDVTYSPLDTTERVAIEKVFRYGVNQIKRISPKIAADIESQLGLAIKMAGIFKEMIPEKKSFAFPSEIGSLGVAWLFPQAIRYATTPSSSAPCWTSYPNNSWTLTLTAGTAAYFFGDGTNFYRASPATGAHAMLLIFNNGVIEIGSTPKISQFRMMSEGMTRYGIYTVAPVVEVSIEGDKAIYQYPTPLGAVPVFYDRGIMWGFMPEASGTSTIKLLGLVFYEHEFASTFKWIM